LHQENLVKYKKATLQDAKLFTRDKYDDLGCSNNHEMINIVASIGPIKS
jgi:hypothetical protein